MAITLYYASMSSAIRTYWAMEELGLPYEKVRLDLMKGEQKTPEFLKINPNGKVPALVDGDAKIFESLAILFHLGETYGTEKGLWPAPNTKEYAEARSWPIWGAMELLPRAMEVAIHGPNSAFPKAPPPEKRATWLAEQATTAWEHNLGILDRQLEGKDHLFGKTFMLCDIAVAGNVNFGMRMVGLPVDAFKNVAARRERCTSRPAFARAMQA